MALGLTLVHPDDLELVKAMVGAAERGEDMPPGSIRIVRDDGEVRHVAITMATRRVGGERPARYVGTAQDVTEHRRAERALEAQLALTESLIAWRTLDDGAERLLAALGGAMNQDAGILSGWSRATSWSRA